MNQEVANFLISVQLLIVLRKGVIQLNRSRFAFPLGLITTDNNFTMLLLQLKDYHETFVDLRIESFS